MWKQATGSGIVDVGEDVNSDESCDDGDDDDDDDVSLRLERRQQRCTGAFQDDTCQKLFESFLFNDN